MSLATTKPTTKRVFPCLVADLIERDDDPVGAAANVAAQFADKDVSIRALETWLGLSDSPIIKHRNGTCSCGDKS